MEHQSAAEVRTRIGEKVQAGAKLLSREGLGQKGATASPVRFAQVSLQTN